MSARIEERTIGGQADKRFVYRGTSAARLMETGNSWNTLRIGFRFALFNAADIDGTPRIALGACSGAEEIWGDLNVKHFVGIRTDDASWARTGTDPERFNAVGTKALTNIDNTITENGSSFVTAYASNDLDVRFGWFVELVRDASNVNVGLYGPSSGTNTITDLTLEEFMTIMKLGDLADISTAKANYNSRGAAKAVAVDEATDGDLNAVCFAWDKLIELAFSDVDYQVIA